MDVLHLPESGWNAGLGVADEIGTGRVFLVGPRRGVGGIGATGAKVAGSAGLGQLNNIENLLPHITVRRF